MKDNILKEIIDINKKVKNYDFYLSQYGFNEEMDSHILEDYKNMQEKLKKIQKELNDEKKSV